jgi:putative transposase
VKEIYRKLGISQATFYNWKKRYEELYPSELRSLKQLKEENAMLKKIVVELSLGQQMLQDVLKKSSKASSEVRAGRIIKPAI